MKLIEEGRDYKVFEDSVNKVFKSENANYIFNKRTGVTYLWGKSFKDNPGKFPAPTILDLEITTKCTGINGRVCPACYKSNSYEGENMTFKTFKKIFDILPKSITQIAFGADSTLKSNPDIWKMMDYCRKNNVVPNITCAQIGDETADNLAKYCGATSVSLYEVRGRKKILIRKKLNSP